MSFLKKIRVETWLGAPSVIIGIVILIVWIKIAVTNGSIHRSVPIIGFVALGAGTVLSIVAWKKGKKINTNGGLLDFD